MKRNFYILLLFFFLFFLTPGIGEEERNVEWYMEEAESAIEKENYEYAVDILKEGQGNYPDAYQLKMLLGNLYSDKELYSLGLKEYEKAKEILPEDFNILYKISTAQGRLNHDRDAVKTLEKILILYPDSPDIITDLGWMYFKTFQLKKGEELLVKAIRDYGNNPGFAMTLGTIYSGMYEYEKAREYYLISIEYALKEERRYFASIAYYNLSLLEHGFYQYNSSLEYTNLSLQMSGRASGHISKGELFQARMDFHRAFEEYQKAYSLDSTPLAKINLATLYQEFGMLDLALAYASEVINKKDNSWMYNYGTDPGRHYMDLNRILAKIYGGIAKREKLKVSFGWTKVKSIKNYLRYLLMEWYHKQEYRALCLEVGRAYLSEGNLLDANWSFYQGNKGYKKVALKYLNLAREFEISIAPQSYPFYQQEEGKIKDDLTLLEDSISEFHPVWEKEGIYNSLTALIPLLYKTGANEEARDKLNLLYTINPGGFLQNGLGLPVLIKGDYKKRLLIYLKKAGLETATDLNAPGFRYCLTFSYIGGYISYSLIDMEQKRTVIREISSVSSFSNSNCIKLVQELVDNIYRIN